MEEPNYSVSDRKTEKPKWSTKAKVTVWGLFGLLILVVIIINVGGAKAKYQVSDTQVTFVNDTTVSVSFKVKDIGNTSGQPICQIDAHSDDHSYYGGGMPRLDKTLKPGETTTTAGPITINKNGAANVTTADVNCS